MNDKVNSGREDGLGQSFKELMHNLLMMHFCDNSMWFSQKIKRNVIAARDSINNQNLPSEYIRIEYMRGFFDDGWKYAKQSVFMREEDQDSDMPCFWTLEQVLNDSFFPLGINADAEFEATERLMEAMTNQNKRSAEMNEKLAASIEDLIPKSLDDIIRLNRDKAQLRLTTDEEILELYHDITPGNPKDIIDDYSLITLVSESLTQVFLLGDVRRTGIQRITSVVLQIDADRQLLTTKSGSLYQLGTPSPGLPDAHQLMCVCAAFHSWKFGAVLGVSHFFY